MMISALKMPAWPTTWPKRRNMMTPRIVSVLGVKTPPKVPNLPGCVFGEGFWDVERDDRMGDDGRFWGGEAAAGWCGYGGNAADRACS